MEISVLKRRKLNPVQTKVVKRKLTKINNCVRSIKQELDDDNVCDTDFLTLGDVVAGIMKDVTIETK